MTRRVSTTAQIKKMLEIDGAVTLRDLMDAFHVTERTARRYVDDLMELFDIEHDEVRKSYRLVGVKEGALPKWADKRLFPLLVQFLSKARPPFVEGAEDAFSRAIKGGRGHGGHRSPGGGRRRAPPGDAPHAGGGGGGEGNG